MFWNKKEKNDSVLAYLETTSEVVCRNTCGVLEEADLSMREIFGVEELTVNSDMLFNF